MILLCSDRIARISAGGGSLVSLTEISRLLELADSKERTELKIRVMQEIQELMELSTIKEDVVLLAIHKTDNILMDSNVIIRIGDTRVPR